LIIAIKLLKGVDMQVGIIGASGYTGGELLRLLHQHSKVEIALATSRSFEGKKVEAAHPNLRGLVNIKFENPGLEQIVERCDFVFLALPHGTSMKVAPELVEAGLKVVDLSGDFRFDNIEVYESYYGKEHTAPELKAVYGLPELHREEIKKASFVANPGCYPTSVILGLAPLVEKNIVDKIVADSKSGISGAGVKPKPVTHFPNADESILAYKVTRHQHLPEIEQELNKIADGVKVSFVPHIIPVIRGISSTIHCFLSEEATSEEIREVFADFYSGEPFVRLLETGEIPRLSAVRGSNFVDIGGFEVDIERERAIIVSVIDNLVKGASGQAIQNMNLMLGYEETLGLLSPGLHP